MCALCEHEMNYLFGCIYHVNITNELNKSVECIDFTCKFSRFLMTSFYFSAFQKKISQLKCNYDEFGSYYATNHY